jgi:hypothetical protein
MENHAPFLRRVRVRAHDQPVHLGVGDQLQRFVRQRDLPRLAHLAGDFRKHESERNAAEMEIVESERIFFVDGVFEIENCSPRKLATRFSRSGFSPIRPSSRSVAPMLQ